MAKRWYALFITWLSLCAVAVGETPNAKYRTPRATVRTLFVAADLAREDPRFVSDAIGCLDLSESRSGGQFGGMIADKLDYVLTALEVKSYQIPDDPNLEEFVLPDAQGHRLALKRMPDGEFRFDAATVSQVSKIWAEMQKSGKPRTADGDVRPQFASPRATFRTFLKALRKGDTSTAVQCLDLQEVSPAARADVGAQMARRLKQVIDRTRLVIFQQIPDVNQAPPHIWLSNPSGIIDLAHLHHGDRKGEWVFTAATLRSIDRLYAENEGKPHVAAIRELVMVDPEITFWQEPELWIRERMPSWTRTTVLKTQHIHVDVRMLMGVAALVLSIVPGFLIVRKLTAGLVRLVPRLRSADLSAKTLRKRIRPLNVLLCILYVRGVVLLLALDRAWLNAALTVLNPVTWIGVAWVASRLIDVVRDVVEAHSASERHVAASQMFMPVCCLFLKILIFLGTLFHLLNLFDWQVTPVLTGLGIGGLAFALGAQDSLKNLFGSFTLIADRPFVVGERVKIGQHGEGVVEVVGLRSTRIRTGDDAMLTVPNSDLTTMHITNYGKRRHWRFKSTLNVVYATPLERLITFRDRLRELISQRVNIDKKKSIVAISDLAASAVEVKIDVFVATADRMSEPDVREEMILEILRLAESLGIEFASPTQLVHVVVPPGAPVRPASTNLSRSADAA